ncbi:hypothetical protein SGLAM104S_08481 [Streptomyces glaucescens]
MEERFLCEAVITALFLLLFTPLGEHQGPSEAVEGALPPTLPLNRQFTFCIIEDLIKQVDPDVPEAVVRVQYVTYCVYLIGILRVLYFEFFIIP